MNRIKILREELKMTQQELADKLDGAKSTIAMYENETRKPSLEVLIKLSEIFNCSIDYLLGKSNYKNESDYIDKNIEQALLTADNAKYLIEKYTNFDPDQIVDKMLEYYKSGKNPIDVVNNILNFYPLEEHERIKQILLFLYNSSLYSVEFSKDKIEQDFQFAYHKEAEGLTDEEISDALRFYKEMKKRVEGDKK